MTELNSAFTGGNSPKETESLLDNNLYEQRQFLLSLLDAIPDLIFFKDIEGKYLGCNHAFASKFIGLTKSEIIGKSDLDFVKDKELARFFIKKDREVMNCGVTRINEETIILANGDKVDVETSKTPVYDEFGRIAGLIGISRDITVRKNMERKVLSEQEYENMLINLVPSAIFSVDKERIITSWNKRAEALTGFTAAEAIGKSCRLFSHEPCMNYCSLCSDRISKPFINRVCTIRNKNGEIRTISKSSDFLKNEKGEVVGGVECIEDITERIATEKILTAVAFSIMELIHNKDFYQAATNCFSLLGPAIGVDRIYLFQNGVDQNGRIITTLKASWYSDINRFGISGSSQPSLPFDVMPAFISFLNKGQVRYGMVEDIKDEAVRQFMMMNGSQSFLYLPIFVRESFWGFIGFDSCLTRKIWTESDFSTLGALASSYEKSIERELTEKELDLSRQAAETASVLKGQFIANMSHEIRTPMNAIMGFVELLSRTELNNEQSEFVREIRTASDSLLILINDILDYSKIEANKVELENYTFNNLALVEESVSLFAPRAHEKGLEINSYVDPGIPDNLVGDPVRLQQVFNNLAGNAIKFTDNGEISISVRLLEDKEDSVTVELNVRDTGIGISSEAQSRLFQVFSQADASTTRKYGGTGLGLAISQKIIQLMGGKLGVTSSPGKGSTFYAHVKLGKDPEASTTNVKNSVDLNILVADQSETSRGILRGYLEYSGCRVTEAISLVGLLEVLGTGEEFDLAIIDYKLIESLGGKPVPTSIGKIDLPFTILMSSDKHRISSDNALANYVQGVIRKPIKKSDLYKAIGIYGSDPCRGGRKENDRAVRTSAQSSADTTAYKLLLVEDMPANRKLAATILKKLGYSTDFAENGSQAVEKCMDTKYDLILMDCQMPVLDGYQATKEIRNGSGRSSESVIVAMTAHAMKGDREKCIVCGMDDYITKPITIANLERTIKKWLKRSTENQG